MACSTDDTGNVLLTARSPSPVQGLGRAKAGTVGAFSRSQNRAILIVAVTTASISLVVAIVSLRWFLSMKRSFRHHLILMLIISDSFKAIWYFLTPVVVFSYGQAACPPGFTQASGFLLAMSVEGADLSILLIALHTTLYVFRPPRGSVHGGLHKYRYWVYGLWIVLPLLAASLAFTNSSGSAYVSTGTIAYLPKRPFWYRLALAWIPRYIILFSIITMYAAIYIYVKVKFKNFDDLEGDGWSSDLSSVSASGHTSLASASLSFSWRMFKQKRYSRKPSTSATATTPFDSTTDRTQSNVPEDRRDSEKFEPITTRQPAYSGRHSQLSLGVTAADFACAEATKSGAEAGAEIDLISSESNSTMLLTRSYSTAPTLTTNFTNDTAATIVPEEPSPTILRSGARWIQNGATDRVAITRVAIRRQLRFLFIYPLIYLFLWIMPFVQHCLNYTDHYTAYPIFWLHLCVTAILALQAGVDCAIFSWRERPWKRMRGPPILSVWAFQKLRARYFARKANNQNVDPRRDMDASGEEAGSQGRKVKRDSYWWEVEGKIRKDSVWLGTGTRHSSKATCQAG